MRKIAKHKTVFDTHAIDASHIYAGFDYGGNICVAMMRENTFHKYRMIMCLGYAGSGACRFTNGSYYSYNDFISIKVKSSQCNDRSSLKGTLAAFSEEHGSDIYEFNTFREFCQWVVEILSK